jgi:hypothetical protein
MVRIYRTSHLKSAGSAVPLVIGALLIIVVGWIIAALLARLTGEILRQT